METLAHLILAGMVITGHAQDSRYITVPSDATSGIGADVMFTCDVDLGTNDILDWSEHITNHAGTTIFTSAEGVVSDPNKYAVNGSYNLIVRKVQGESGGSYSCKLALKTGPRQSADLVVLLEPTIAIPNMTHGEWGSISCTARFGGPLRGNLKPTHIPRLDMFLGDNALGTTTNDVEQEGSRRQILQTIGRTVTYTANHADHDKLVRCVVYTQTPSFQIQSEQVLQVIFPVRDISISPRETSYYVGEHINCAARGNPEPSFKWVPITVPPDSGTGIISGPTLVMEQLMIGENEWECEATNNVQGTNRIWSRITFTVVGHPRYITVPSDVTSGIGANVMFTCDVDLGTPLDSLDWTEHITNYGGNLIFSTIGVSISDTNQYVVNGSYNLIVKKVTWQNGGLYSCKLASKPGERQSANLVVLDEPSIEIPPLAQGQSRLIQCTALFGAPLHQNMDPAHMPRLEMFLGSEGFGTNEGDLVEEGIPGQRAHTLRRSIEYTANHADHDKLVRCVVSTQTPSFQVQSEQVLQIFSGQAAFTRQEPVYITWVSMVSFLWFASQFISFM